MIKNNKDFYVENVLASERVEELVHNISVGDNVKLILTLNKPTDGIDAERLWFRVIKINDDLTLEVELDNDPLYIKSLSGNDRLIVSRQNVLEVLK